ncbi:MAG: hypothetical protein GKR96_12965 [Gammaproteobacteria bacterium]|nr:hypothetical protein [Gammaproteobacteria bacterium]
MTDLRVHYPHLVLLNLKQTGLTGQQAQDTLAELNITSNKNPIPFDSAKPSEWVGLRLGVAAATTRGLNTTDMESLGLMISGSLRDKRETGSVRYINELRASVADLCKNYPIY